MVDMTTAVIDAIHPQRLQRVSQALGEDVRRCITEVHAVLNASGTVDQFWARAVVRSFFAWLEGYTFEMRSMALDAHRIGLSPLTEVELAILLESTYELDDRAHPRVRSKFQPIERLMRFALTTLAKVYDFEMTFLTSGDEWRKFQDTLRLRHRITHPKDVQALEINIDEIVMAMNAFTWCYHTYAQFFEQVSSQFKSSAFRERLAEVAKKHGA